MGRLKTNETPSTVVLEYVYEMPDIHVLRYATRKPFRDMDDKEKAFCRLIMQQLGWPIRMPQERLTDLFARFPKPGQATLPDGRNPGAITCAVCRKSTDANYDAVVCAECECSIHGMTPGIFPLLLWNGSGIKTSASVPDSCHFRQVSFPFKTNANP